MYRPRGRPSRRPSFSVSILGVASSQSPVLSLIYCTVLTRCVSHRRAHNSQPRVQPRAFLSVLKSPPLPLLSISPGGPNGHLVLNASNSALDFPQQHLFLPRLLSFGSFHHRPLNGGSPDTRGGRLLPGCRSQVYPGQVSDGGW